MSSLTGPGVDIWVKQLSDQPQPLLTWYSGGRVELAGPVLARWFAKVDNYLHEEFPFGGDGYALVLPDCWQKTVWEAGLRLRGWQSTSPEEADLLISDDTNLLADCASRGVVAIAQPTDPLGLRWEGTLPPGVVDAPGELLALSDVPTDPLPNGPEWAQESSLLAGLPTPPGRVFMQVPNTKQMLQIWSNGGSVLVINDWQQDQDRTRELLQQEQVTQVLA